MYTQEMKDRADSLSKVIIGAAIEVHRHLGPGLLESTYEACLCRELTLRNLAFVRQKPLPVFYKGVELDCSYIIDMEVEGLVVLELKSVEKLQPIHEAQLLTYLKLSQRWLGLLINFNELRLVDGVSRLVCG
jgi:GxxExxY protein